MRKECFTSGPIGSEAYEKGWWETTGRNGFVANYLVLQLRDREICF